MMSSLATGLLRISNEAFVGVGTGLLVVIIVALFNHFRPRSYGQAFGVGVVTALVGMIALSAVTNIGSDEPDSASPVAAVEPDRDQDGAPDIADACPDEAGPVEAEGCPPPADQDEDQILDAVDACPDEPGLAESEGCPPPADLDEDGVPDSMDRCPKVAAPIDDGCPPQPQEVNIETLVNDGRAEGDETTELTEVVVGGFEDPMGLRMQVGSAYPSGEFTIAANRQYQTIRGRVGVTSQPCSSGSWGTVAIQDGEGHTLWPPKDGAVEVDSDAVPFKVRIASVDTIILYAEGSDASRTSCNSSGTNVGWVNTRLIAVE